MFETLLIHQTTRLSLEAAIKHPPHALLLIGPRGMGKFTLAQAWAQKVAGFYSAQVLSPDEKGTIAIDSIRELYRATRTKQSGRQVVIIDHAEAMGDEAQNALLKLLEEPRPGVTFILTASNREALLPTILSRVQTIHVLPVSDQALQTILAKHKDILSDKLQLLFIAAGRPATLVQLLAEPAAFAKHRAIMQQAKELLAVSMYNRLTSISKLATSRDDCTIILDAMQRMAVMQLKKSTTAHEHWLAIAHAAETALYSLEHNGNPKAQLLQFFTSY